MKPQLHMYPVPLAVLTAYYRRNLRIPPGGARARSSEPAGRCHVVRVAVTDEPGDQLRCSAVDVTVVEFATHTAYLEPVTGMGVLVVPRPEVDITAADDWCASWNDGPAVGLSVQAADRANALQVLAAAGWTLLEAADGALQLAGHTADGCPAVCLYADRTTYEQLLAEDYQRGFSALRGAARLGTDR